MEVGFSRGVYLPELDLWLDSLRRRDFGLISHAHSDHTARHSRAVLTRNTGLLLSDFLKNSATVYLDYHAHFFIFYFFGIVFRPFFIMNTGFMA